MKIDIGTKYTYYLLIIYMTLEIENKYPLVNYPCTLTIL